MSQYLDLLKSVLTGEIYEDGSIDPSQTEFSRRYLPYNPERRRSGKDWPQTALTMVGRARLDHLEWCIRTLVSHDIIADVCECGVWRGGASIFMRLCFDHFGAHDVRVWACDSYDGIPPVSTPEDASLANLNHIFELSVSLETVQRNFLRFGAENHVTFVKGRFCHSLPNVEIQKLCLLRLDGDTFEATRDGLENLYPKLVTGGFCIIDDWGAIEPCRNAVAEYRSKNGITEAIADIDGTGVYWRKASQVSASERSQVERRLCRGDLL